MSYKRKERLLPYLFMLPAIVIILGIYLVPFLPTIFVSLTDWDGFSWSMNFVGLENYIAMFQDPVMLEVLFNNIRYFLILVFVQNFLALVIAVAIEKCFVGKNIFRSIYFMPTIVATVAVGFIWSLMLDPVNGSISLFAQRIGLDFVSDIMWLGDYDIAIYSVAFVSLWQWTGWNMVVYLAGLQSIPKSLYEAADIDGSYGISKFFRITLPMLAPSITVNIVYSSIGALKFFDLPYIMVGGGPGHATETLAISIYRNAFLTNRMGYASANSMILFLLVLTVSIVQTLYLRKAEEDVT